MFGETDMETVMRAFAPRLAAVADAEQSPTGERPDTGRLFPRVAGGNPAPRLPPLARQDVARVDGGHPTATDESNRPESAASKKEVAALRRRVADIEEELETPDFGGPFG